MFVCKTLILVILLLIAPASRASDDIEISGLVIDRTLTRFGKDFAFYYSGYWRDLTFTQGANVTLTETVFPQAGTKLTVEINGTLIYVTHFGRRASPVKERAEEAVLRTVDYLAHIQAEALSGELAAGGQ
ncbi:curli production assembly/transport protein CsgE [Shewanella submarina]|uniref:Curli production assembly/transport component CsgE n=1 Tax=Shewanella submarina TaxID=2016376 RepID=A0ABV7GJN7_9GAMM|nr:curli production assembly/transport protein CsgE [Shewanella submarina]MCL1036065.1 curli production assembly/transport protein CsgE [Shewanella submarina]